MDDTNPRSDERERCARFTEDVAMAIVARGIDLNSEITVRMLVNFLQRHADDLRAWDGETYEVVEAPDAPVPFEIKATA